MTLEEIGYRIPSWLPTVAIAAFTALLSAVWLNLNDQGKDLKLDMRGQMTEVRGDIRVLQAHNEDLTREITVLRQRVGDLVDGINARRKPGDKQ